jgi:anthranilate synthase component I
MQPELSEAHRLAGAGFTTIPVHASIHADTLTPISALSALHTGQHAFLLESVEGGETLARYSFIGTQPRHVLVHSGSDPLLQVQQTLDTVRYAQSDMLPQSFVGGYVGYIGYDCVHYYEPTVQRHQLDELQLPEAVLMYATHVVIFDHVKHRIIVVDHIQLDKDADVEQEYKRCCKDINETIRKLNRRMEQAHSKAESLDQMNAATNIPEHDRTQFEDAVNTLKEHIHCGDIIQAVPSRVSFLFNIVFSPRNRESKKI